ncbi:hypothetical protein RZA67_03425 [Stenotrophomonas sp. C3(2023)]|uniref:hypothetical protein n=1 Tax=Stenotrophomonas sp. C3(2023) TaxID=3080277 RepID=UPI00293C81B5|nr:hypothetical protein [Stenotrophomonas sp. C3(2023)]MDV3467782.1 hypothetical protein [Stenotrophomonas sp. C3(2023)]
MQIRCVVIGLTVGLLLATVPAHAARQGELVQMNGQHPVEPQVRAVEQALSTDDYSELSLEDRSKVRAALNRIRTVMGDKQTVAEINPGARVDVFNEQQLVNTLLTQAHADSRMVCRRERATGSNRLVSNCMTVAQRRKAAEDAKDSLQRSAREGSRAFDERGI